MMEGLSIRARATESLELGGIDIFAYGREGGQLHHFKLTEHGEPTDPNLDGGKVEHCATFSADQAQALADDLWAAGIRPSKRPDASAVLTAKDQHLADLREALFMALGKCQSR